MLTKVRVSHVSPVSILKHIDDSTFIVLHCCHTLLLYDILSCIIIINTINCNMPATRKRKATAEDTVAVSKPHGRPMATEQTDNTRPSQAGAKKKRKTQEIDSDGQVTNNVTSKGAGSMVAPSAKSSKRQREDEHATPQNKRFKNMLPPTPAETPTRGARNLFDKLNLTPSGSKRTLETPPLTPESLEDSADIPFLDELPLALQEHTKLFSSFLNATSLYMAHHGAGSPLYLSALCPLITKTWKKRTVSEKDVQRLLGVLGVHNPFVLLDNGEGGIILEKADHGSLAAGHLDQHDLAVSFEHKICALWRDSVKTGESAQSVANFMEALPLANIAPSDVAADPTKLAQSKERLSQFKREVLQTRIDEAASKKPIVPEEAKTASAVTSRGSSLLDRIMAKQQLLSTRPSGPTQEEVDRRAALDRIEEVVLIMEMLAGGRPRVSFSSQMMIQHLQNSLRNPISKEEAERCIGLIANEVAPSFVSLIQTGNVRGVVVKRQGRPTNVQLRQSLQNAGA